MKKIVLMPEDRTILSLQQIRLRLVQAICEIDAQIELIERLKKMKRGGKRRELKPRA